MLYRPLSQIVVTLIGQFREVKSHRPRFGAAPAFTLAVIVLIVAAIASSTDWPHDAKLVPLTACGMALAAALLNLVNELFGREQPVLAHVDSGVQMHAAANSGVTVTPTYPSPASGGGMGVGDLGVADDVVRRRRRSCSFSGWRRLSALSR